MSASKTMERQAEYVTAVADVAAMFPAYKSHAEEAWVGYGDVVLLGELGQHTAVMLYEPMSFRLLGETYKPDFMHLLEDGRVVFVEVKGVFIGAKGKKIYMKSYRDARSKLRAAAELHPWFTWIEARQENGGWIVERM